MGYSHYFRTHKDGIPVSAWANICADTRTLLNNLPSKIVIQFEDDELGKPAEVSDSLIRFNGNGELGHETFYFERVPDPKYANPNEDKIFAFCKTAYKPYDIVVCGVLIVAAKHAASYITVSSDGSLDDWIPAFEWVASVLGPEYDAAFVAQKLKGGHFELGGITE